MNSPVLYILTPVYNSMCTIHYMSCLINTLDYLKQQNISVHVEFCSNDSLITRARNNLIAKAMTNPEMTHVLFIDSDIIWSPNDIVTLIRNDKDVIGGIYPKKKYHFNDIHQALSHVQTAKNIDALKNIPDERIFESKLLKYNFNPIHSSEQIQSPILEVRDIATGFLMIKRNVIEKMQQHLKDKKYRDDIGFLSKEEEKNAYALFRCDVQDEHFLSEDWYFCNIWKRLGGSIFANLNINLSHFGNNLFQGSVLCSALK